MQCCDKYQLLGSFIDEHKEEKGILISVLHKAQELFGELNEDVQTFVADNLGIPLIEVYGVSTFYARKKRQIHCWRVHGHYLLCA